MTNGATDRTSQTDLNPGRSGQPAPYRPGTQRHFSTKSNLPFRDGSSLLDIDERDTSTQQTGFRSYVGELDNMINTYRAGQQSKFEVVRRITEILENDHNLTMQERTQVFDLYWEEISSIQVKMHVSSHESQPEPSADERQLSKPHHRKRDWSVSELDHHKSRKRQKLGSRDMPWDKQRYENVQPVDASCVKSAEIICKLSTDIEAVKFYITIAPAAPAGIPMSEWEHIFMGEAIDLDRILSFVHRVTMSNETTRKVETAFEWTIAWKSAARATAFVFKHRESELLDYGNHIMSLFAAKRVSSHEQIILYDKGIRNRVGGGQTILLTQYHLFPPFHTVDLEDERVEYSRRKKRGRGRAENLKGEVCLRFNKGSCWVTESVCRFRHACLICGESGHGKKSCHKISGPLQQQTSLSAQGM